MIKAVFLLFTTPHCLLNFPEGHPSQYYSRASTLNAPVLDSHGFRKARGKLSAGSPKFGAFPPGPNMRRGPARRSGLHKQRAATCGRDGGRFEGLMGAKITRKVPHSFPRSPNTWSVWGNVSLDALVAVTHEWTGDRP